MNFPALSQDSDGNVYIDTPGFKDKNAFKNDLASNLLVKKLLN